MGGSSVDFQATSEPRVRVKNTFLDDWEDSQYAIERQSSSRPFRTCPDLSTPDEPESELSPDDTTPETSHVCSFVLCVATRADATHHLDKLDHGLTREFAVDIKVVTERCVCDDSHGGQPPQQPAGLVSSAVRGCTSGCHNEKEYPSSPSCSAPTRGHVSTEVFALAGAPVDSSIDVQRRRHRGRRVFKNNSQVELKPPVDGPSDALAYPNLVGATPHKIACLPEPRANRRSCRGSYNGNRLWCNLYINEDMQKPGFELNKKIIGHGGQGTKRIFEATGAKIRLRGHGSGHVEGAREAPVHLMLSVTTEHWEIEPFRKAFGMATELLQDVERRFRQFSRQKKETLPQEPCFWVGEISAESQACIGAAFDRVATFDKTAGL